MTSAESSVGVAGEWTVEVDEPGMALLGACIGQTLRLGDCLALHGDLGQGKTTFARALIRAWHGGRDLEVPSPTFPIVQQYDLVRGAIRHYDLYRIADPSELEELGFEDTLGSSIVLIEWPERAGDLLPAGCITVTFAAARSPDRRVVTISAPPAPAARLARPIEIFRFLDTIAGWREAIPVSITPDASSRSYFRLLKPGSTETCDPAPERGSKSQQPKSETYNPDFAHTKGAVPISAILMDAPKQADGPPLKNGKPYSQIAHLAEDIGPFVAVDQLLLMRGIAAPRLLAADFERGFLLIEDFGNDDFGAMLARGHDQREMYRAATDVLVALRRKPCPRDLPILRTGRSHHLPRFDRDALEIELSLLLDWYWPEAKGAPVPDDVRAEYNRLWAPLLDRMLAEPPGLFLRDYHSPNLFWRPNETGLARVGVIDFQDALAEPWAYDLVSVLQDARVTVPAELETELFAHYCASVAGFDPSFDRDAFAATYAVFGAERNTRLVGLWVRLLRRDNKPGYLRHMSRTWDYLLRNLRHPALASIAGWYEAHFPQDIRNRPIDP